jgi:2-methylisocitrate lyase-like PEP mutase family enzyme
VGGLLASERDRRSSLRETFEAGEMVLAPGCYDALGARLVEEAGFPAAYMTGFGSAASHLGRPDVGLMSLPEMVDNARRIAHAVDIPVIADADTGYGNSINVIRTVREYEAAGVAAIHIEDQVMPKKCGHMEGKQSCERLRELGFSLVIFPLTLLLVATRAMRAALARVKADGTPIELLPSLIGFDEFVDFIGLPEIRELEQRFAEG